MPATQDGDGTQMKVETVFAHHKAKYNLYRISDGDYSIQVVVAKTEMHRYGEIIETAKTVVGTLRKAKEARAAAFTSDGIGLN